MAKVAVSTKRIAIGKANSQMVAVVAVASFVTVFCLIAASYLWGLRGYQSRVITEKEKAHKQLTANITAVNNLVNSYQAFVSTPTNIINGNSNGTGDNDGDNAKIVLDALPSKYDFPALTSSLEKIVKDKHITTAAIGGTDDEVAQAANASSPSPQPVPMPFTISVSNVNYNTVQDLITTLERSIRPIQIDTVNISGSNTSMSLSLTAHTYYQPEKDLKITTKVVK